MSTDPVSQKSADCQRTVSGKGIIGHNGIFARPTGKPPLASRDFRVGDWWKRDGTRRRIWRLEMNPNGQRWTIYSESPSSKRHRVTREDWLAWMAGATLIKRTDMDDGEVVG